MSESNLNITTPPDTSPHPVSAWLWAVRYGIGIVMVAGGIVVLAINPAGVGVDGFAMAAGGGLSVLMLNALYRLGVSGDEERARHEQAWRYFEEHGEWPEDPPPRKRQWVLPAGVLTAEAEAAQRAARQQDVSRSTGATATAAH
ncbi:MAG TPA: hypothetical protein VEF89_19255 [Solirubrobacteraceae bacterium]|nr:hypothetical protein [Solirubrobacteraceae bacterium]